VLQARAEFRPCSMSDALGLPCLSTAVGPQRTHEDLTDIQSPSSFDRRVPRSFRSLVSVLAVIREHEAAPVVA
jgi:hypothetical protein